MFWRDFVDSEFRSESENDQKQGSEDEERVNI